MVTTNQKPTIDTQKLKRKEHKHTTKENHQATVKKKKKLKEEEKYIKWSMDKQNNVYPDSGKLCH